MGTVLDFFTSKDVVHLWSILALLLGMSYWVWVFLGGKMGLNHRTRVLMVSVSLTASIWLWKIAYIIFSDQFAWPLIFDKLVESVRMFSLEQKYSEFVPELSRMLTTIWPVMANKFIAFAVKVGFSLLYFSAPATGAFVILNVILRFFSKLALWQKAVFSKKEIFYFSKLNESSYALAKDICNNEPKKPVIVFADAYLDDEEEKSSELFISAKCLGAICLKDDILHVSIRKRGKKTIALMDTDEIKNVQVILSLVEKAKKNKNAYKSLANAHVLLFSDDRTFSMVSEKTKDELDVLFPEKKTYCRIRKFISFAEEKARERLRSKSLRRLCIKIKEILDEVFPETVSYRPKIRTVNCYGNMVKNLLKNMPLYEPLVGNTKNVEQQEIEEKKERSLNVTIVGAGRIGLEVFLSAYWYGQMLGCKLHLNVVSKESEISFLDRINFINPEIFGTSERINGEDNTTPERVSDIFCNQGSLSYSMRTKDYSEIMVLYPEDKSLAKPYFTFRYFQTDIRDDDLAHKLGETYWEDGFCLQDTDYFVVALGNDDANIQVTEKLNKYVSEYHLKKKADPARKKIEHNTVIACAVYNSAISRALNQGQEYSVKNWGTYVYAFGDFESVYTVENVYMRSEDEQTYNNIVSYDDITYDRVEQQSEVDSINVVHNLGERLSKRSQYEYWASLARALHLRYKVFSAGKIKESVFTGGDRKEAEQQALNEYVSFICRYKYVNARYNYKKKNKRLIQELLWLEHRRWCAYTRICGFTKPDDYAQYEDYTKEHKEMKLKLHPCLVESDIRNKEAGMDDSLDKFCRRRNQDYKKYDHPFYTIKKLKDRIDAQKKMEKNKRIGKKK